jgi:glycerate kinase
VFGPQKGATPDQVDTLEAGLARLAECMRKETGLDTADLPGAGAAGGMGAAMLAWLNAELKPGAELVLELAGFEHALGETGLVFTAEGRLDSQTVYGKAPAAVAAKASAHGIPCIALGGSLGDGIDKLLDAGFSACFSICNEPMGLETAMQNAGELIASTAEQAMRCYLAGSRSG